jgi:hypothetical protein
MSTIKEKLIKSLHRKRMIYITRPYPGEPSLNGFVLGVGEDLVLIRQFHDFYPEGYAVLRIEEIATVEYGERERLFEYIIVNESIVDLAEPVWICKYLHGLADLLKQVEFLGCTIIVECEGRDWDDNDEFYVGRIICSDEISISIKCLNSSAEWESRHTTVLCSNITKLQIDTPYVNMISRYSRSPKKGRSADGLKP